MQIGKGRLAAFATLVAALPACVFAVAALACTPISKTSGVYLTAADYKDGRLAFQGVCGSKTHKLELHDVRDKPYIDVTHESEKRRYPKNDLFGYRGCDGRDYRFVSNFEYQILESRDLSIYARDIGSGRQSRRKYYFSVGPEGQALALTIENLKQAFPDSRRFQNSLDATFGKRRGPWEYDKFDKMFTVNRLLIASREP